MTQGTQTAYAKSRCLCLVSVFDGCTGGKARRVCCALSQRRSPRLTDLAAQLSSNLTVDGRSLVIRMFCDYCIPNICVSVVTGRFYLRKKWSKKKDELSYNVA
jgi:hypothetical protein